MKQILFLIAILSITATNYAQTFTVDGLEYEVTSTNPNEVTITGGTPATTDLVIPQTVSDGTDTFTVTSVGTNAFREAELTAVTIPTTIVTIGGNSFLNNQLSSLVLPDGITSIGPNAFGNNSIQGNLIIPNSVSSIGRDAFRDNQLQSVTISNAITSIGEGTFQRNVLTSVTLPTALIEIDEDAFRDNQITTLALPETVTIIRDRAFLNNQIASLVLPAGIVTIGGRSFQNNQIPSLSIPDGITTIENQAFQNNEIASLSLPEGLTTIGAQAFRGNDLTSLILPASITNIEGLAFGGNPLNAINALGSTPAAIATGDNDTFGTNRIAIDLTIPPGSEAVYEDATWIGFRTVNGIRDFEVGDTFTENNFNYIVLSLSPNEVEITGGTDVPQDLTIEGSVSSLGSDFTVTRIGNDAFREISLATLILPDGLTEIGAAAFRGNQITSVDLPASLVTIGFQAFLINQLTSITFPEGLTTIGGLAFQNNQLASITFPASITSIGARAFESNPLTTINALGSAPAAITTGTNDTFGTNRIVIDLTIPPGSEAVYEAATWTGFRTVNGIRDFEVGDTFTENNFNYIVLSLSPNEVEITGGTDVPQNLTIAGTVTSEGSDFTVTRIGNDAFRDISLVALILSEGITEIGNAAFRGNQITSVDLPASLVTIGFQAFINNQLTSITFPASITEIAARAFEGNPLTAITALGITPATITTGANDTFGTNRNIIDLTIPPGSEADYEAATWTGFRTVNGIRDFEVGDTFTENNFNYTVLSVSPNEAEITGGTDVPQDLTIQGSVSSLGSDFTVTRIGNDAFRENSLTSVNVLIGITEIGNAAFRGNQITSVVLPASLVTIGFQAFINNQLTSLTLPEGLTTIGGQAFLNNQLTDLTFPVGLTTIGGQAFQNNQLTSLTLPEGLTMIEGRSFQNNQLTSITFPASITDIGSRAFEDNFLAEIISLGSTPPSITTGTDDTFGANRLDIDLTIPPGSEAAYEAATWTGFRSVNGVLNVVIGSVFTENDFDYRRTSFSPDEVQIIGGTLSSTDLSIPETVSDGMITYTVTSVGDEAFEDAGLTSIDLPSSIRLIESQSFQNNQLTSLTIPTSVTTINTRAFRNNQIESVVIPNSVTTLGNGAFELNNLSSVTISENLTSIGNQTFRNNQLTTVTIPANINSLGDSCFRENPSLTEVIVLNTIPPALGDDPFLGLRENIDLTIPSGTETAYEAAAWTGFRSVNGILNFELGDTFTENNFNYTVISLTPNEVEITGGTDVSSDLIIQESVPNGGRNFTVTRVGNDAFREISLTNVSLPNSLTEIGASAFRGNQITSLILPAGITTIGNAAFLNNELTQLLLPVSITEIRFGAFAGNLLETITALGFTPATIFTGDQDTFGGNRDSIDLIVPEGTTAAYEAATWTGFRSINGILNFEVGDTFTENNFNYTVISITPNEVEITGGTDVLSNLIIQESVPSGGRDFTVTRVGNDAFRENSLTNLSLPNSLTEIGASAFRSNQITSLILPAGITTIGNDAFLNNELTQLLLPESITEIRFGAFAGNLLETITALGTTPSTIFTGDQDTFGGNRDSIDLIVPLGTQQAYTDATWTGFGSVETAVIDGIFYTETSLSPNEAQVVNVDTSTLDIVIPATVSNGAEDFTVTAIGTSALSNKNLTSVVLPNTLTATGFAGFSGNNLTSVVIPEGISIISKQSFQNNEQLSTIDFPNSITVIDNNAFRNNGLTQVILPANVSAIGIQTFEDNPINEVTSFNTEPPSIAGSSFGNRNQIILNVPEGTTAAYIAEGWTDFAEIIEFEIDIRVAPKVFLQGASLNPIAGEEDLMRDSLRENNLLPTLSPYGDGTSVSPTVFTTTGPDAIIDWVLVELREGPDNENTTVIASKAALLQRDGDIVGLDGTSEITFTVDDGDYFIAIKHRNHIGILAAVPAPLTGTASTIDFTQDITTAKGENLALTTLVNGTFAMIAGDADGSSQILNTDITEGLTLAGGGEDYSNADADMNGFVLNSDIQLLILGNSGTVQQFE